MLPKYENHKVLVMVISKFANCAIWAVEKKCEPQHGATKLPTKSCVYVPAWMRKKVMDGIRQRDFLVR